MNELTTVLTSAAVSAALTGLILFLTKTWITERLRGAIKHEYDEKLETHKAQLQASGQVELERLRAELQIAASERNIRLSRVYERTVEAAEGVYARLLEVRNAVGAYVNIVEWSGEPSKAERRRVAGEKYADFVSFYSPKRPFLPKRIVMQIDELKKQLHATATEFMVFVEQRQPGSRREPDDDVWFRANETMTKEVPPILDALEDDLRKMLAISD